MRLTPRGNPSEVDGFEHMIWLENQMEQAIIENTPVDTGEGVASWQASVTPDGFEIWSSTDHLKYPEFGTKTPITPKNGPVLVFRGRNGRLYSLKRVRGQKAQLFVRRALRRFFGDDRITLR